MEKITKEIGGNPNYIVESTETRLFLLVKDIIYKENNFQAWENNWIKNEMGDVINLRKGFDIIETAAGLPTKFCKLT